MPNLQPNFNDCEISLKNKGNIKMFPGKQKLIICQQKTLIIKNTKKNTSGKSKIITDRSSAEMKEKMKITEQNKYVTKSKYILIIINNIDYVYVVYRIKIQGTR